MGEVYRARDGRLGREVALKVLPAGVASEPDRLARFEQEARAASALNHPNIVTIYEIGRADGVSYIAMELVDGQTAGGLIAGGPMPARRLVHFASQVAEGLAKAHTAGIVHRDLKPENLMLSRDGFVKILDFGLAKLATPSPDSLTGAATAGAPQTGAGVVLGTISYLSPEQASGRALDFRSDQFAFGSVLYEMLIARHRASTARDRQVCPGDEHARPGEIALRDGVAHGDVHEGAVGPDVADGREPRVESRPGVGDRLEGSIRRGGLQLGERVGVVDVVADEVRMAIDEAGEDRQRGKVGDLRAGGNGRSRAHGANTALLDHDDRVGDDGPRLRVDQMPGPDRDDLRRRLGRAERGGHADEEQGA